MRKGSIKTKRQYYTYKEILNIVKKLENSEIVSFNADVVGRALIDLHSLNTNTKKLAKSFYEAYFKQEFGILQSIGKDDFKFINVFDLPINEGEKSSINLKKCYINDNYYYTSFESITLVPEETISQTEEYIHEIGHALLERNNKVDDPLLSELIPILLELIFAYDIDTDKNNFIEKNNIYLNKYNMSSVAYENANGELEYNYATLRYLMHDRVSQLLALKDIYKKENNIKNKENYSKYLKSIEEALLIFESVINGNILVFANIEEALKGNITITEFVEKCKQDYEDLLNNNPELTNKAK